jgi:hypothetical protein
MSTGNGTVPTAADVEALRLIWLDSSNAVDVALASGNRSRQTTAFDARTAAFRAYASARNALKASTV